MQFRVLLISAGGHARVCLEALADDPDHLVIGAVSRDGTGVPDLLMDLYHLYQQDNYAYVIILQNICRMLSRRLRKADGRIVEFLAGATKAPAPKAAAPKAKQKARA